MNRHPYFAVLLLGALAVLGYAPFYLYPVPILTLAGLFHFLKTATSRKQAFMLGYLYGLGMFGAGVSWIYVSLHDFGGMPLPLAALATAALCAFIAGFPGETEAEFQHLLDFVQEAQIDRAGCFAYSPVKGAAANDLPDAVPEEVKQERYEPRQGGHG